MTFKYLTLALTALALTTPAFAKDKEPEIAANTSGLSAELSDSIARTAMSMGVKEPLTISKDGANAKVSGSNTTVCTAKLNDGKMMGFSCK